jgi:hypothetical protein
MHLHFLEVPLSSVHLTAAEASGEVASAYGLASSICRHRLPASHHPMASFFAPSHPSPRPSARRAAPPRQMHDNGPATSAA